MKRTKSAGEPKLPTLPPPTLRLDLACGANKREGFIGVDVAKLEGVDVVLDLNELHLWPWEPGSVAEIHCSHYVEHLPYNSFFPFFDKCWQVLVPGGTMTVIAPYYTSMRAWQDPLHMRAISEATFLYCNKGWRELNRLTHYPVTCDFDYTYGYNVDPAWLTRSQEARDYAIRHYWNVVHDIHVTLTKRPGVPPEAAP